MNTPPPFGFSCDNPNPYGGWNDGGARMPVPIPHFAGIIVQEAADSSAPRHAPALPPRPSAPASGPNRYEAFREKFAAIEQALLYDRFDPAVRIESYQEMAALDSELFEIPIENRAKYWKSFVEILPDSENQKLSDAQRRELYKDKAQACAMIYRYCPQIYDPSCFSYLKKMGAILDDLKAQRQAGPPLLALLKTCEVCVRGTHGKWNPYDKWREYRKLVYPAISKDINEVIEKRLLEESEIKMILDTATKVVADDYMPERMQSPFLH